jgi:hypothetical protein
LKDLRQRPAADPQHDALFAAKAALKHASAIRRDADAQLHQLQRVIDRLERKDVPPAE